ncbi:hypothetical protein A3B85_02455 [Candidatus Nomurabacteria bacterium RIFCSPHIGHO2_02_FULL_37_13]|uniref:Mannosyl-glycoprotein endo-beta-N-acetylglucosamidase-like domain-containing protein n=1 Tax=Candidatus Nomurabacteria bacterium RIFCSPHIGHO2_02_FULL_37_13 TaxID=1801750 RepID=A0A1F6W4B5_9BACT|nr:MAG: hypothetical protein A3B85_02455 [Candidatus Nomurabacteria bacterium RIFCSPHIGHO2_02_FULL_37_13]
MKNIKLIRFVESFILLPITTMTTISSVPAGSITQATINIVSSPKTVLLQKLNIEGQGLLAFNQVPDPALQLKTQTLKAEADTIDAYFQARNMPLRGMGMKMAEEADKNSLDWRLLPAIAVRESTGGKFDCKKVTFNPFGWGSCKIGFKSNEEAIEIVAKNLGGNNPKTAHYYGDKTTKQILRAYNPPSIVPRYAEQVISIMNAIGDADMAVTVTSPTSVNT